MSSAPHHPAAPGRAAPGARPRTIGLALGGGGARGLAHILALEVFDELGLKPKVIAGTSIGAIFGAAYAAGLSAAEIRAHTRDVLRQRVDLVRQLFAARAQPLTRILSLMRPQSALLNSELLLARLLPKSLPDDFASLPVPLKIVAADFFRQEQLVLESGALSRAIAASVALPAIFAPVMLGQRTLLDGGLVNPLPFDLLAGEADIIVAVDVSGARSVPGQVKPPSAFDALISSFQILQHSIVREKLRSQQPDVLVEFAVERFFVLDFHRMDEILAAAAPAKELLRDRLTRVLAAETLEPLAAPKAEPQAPSRPKRRFLRRASATQADNEK